MDKIELLGKRQTKARQALLEALKSRHLTFKELQLTLNKKGFTNVSTLYNNIKFFKSNNVITEFTIDGVTYYDLGMNNPFYKKDSHIHLLIKNKELQEVQVKEINYDEIYDAIKSHPIFKVYDIEYIRILVSAVKLK